MEGRGETELELKEGARFYSFEEVEKALAELKEKHHHPFRVFNSQTVKDANLRRLKAKNPCDPIDEKWRYTYYGVRCVHFGNPRQRGKGLRPNQQHSKMFAMGCPAKITIVYDRLAKPSKTASGAGVLPRT